MLLGVIQPAMLTRSDGHTVMSARLQIGGNAHSLWYRVSAAPLAAGPEPLLAAALLPAMAAGVPLRLPGLISDQLSGALSTIQEIFHSWDPALRIVSIENQPATAATARAERVACFFSGGIDSWYSVLKHQDEISTLIFVHGFDLTLENTSLRQSVVRRLREAAAQLGKPLLEVETNIREFVDPYVSWDLSHGAAMASVALLLSAQFSKVYIAASNSYQDLYPWGSHPLLDPLWSTETTALVHDGCEANRFEKVTKVATSDVALRTLRVCWENRDGGYNCGHCVKCLRAMVDLKLVGALERCHTLPHRLDLAAISRMSVPKRYRIDLTLQAAERLGDEALVRALRKVVARRDRASRHPALRAVLQRVRRLTQPRVRRRAPSESPDNDP
jgi:hypothetical protein